MEKKGNFSMIVRPCVFRSHARCISSSGDIVGTYGAGHSFLLSKGVFTMTDVPGATLTNNRGINARGDISGNYIDASGNTHGFLRTK